MIEPIPIIIYSILYLLLETSKPSVSSLAVCHHGAPLLPPVKRRIPGNIGKAVPTVCLKTTLEWTLSFNCFFLLHCGKHDDLLVNSVLDLSAV